MSLIYIQLPLMAFSLGLALIFSLHPHPRRYYVVSRPFRLPVQHCRGANTLTSSM